MDWLAIPVFAFCAAVFAVGYWYERRQAVKTANRLHDLQASRNKLSRQQIADTWRDDEAGLIAQRMLRIMAEVSEFSLTPPGGTVDPARLRPEDRLGEDLGYHLDSLSFCELETRLEREFEIRLRISDFESTPTVGDVVRLVAAKVNDK